MVTPGIYQHFKGGRYEVLLVERILDTDAPDAQDHTKTVIYKALYDSAVFGNNAVWARRLSEFEDMVLVDGVSVPRFQRVL
jgi:hypothetical protein